MKNGIIFTILLAVAGVFKLVGKIIKSLFEVLTGLVVFFGLYIPLFYLVFGLLLLGFTDFRFGGTGVYQILYYIGLGISCLAALIISIRNFFVRPLSHVFAPLRRHREEAAERASREDDREYYERGEGRRPYDRYDYDEEYRRDRRDYDDGYYGSSRRYADPAEGDPYDRNFSPCGYGEGRSYSQEGYGYTRNDPRPPYRYEQGGEEQGAPYGYMGRRPMQEVQERPLIYYSKRRPGVLVKEYSDRFELFEEDATGRRFIGTEYKDD